MQSVLESLITTEEFTDFITLKLGFKRKKMNFNVMKTVERYEEHQQ